MIRTVSQGYQDALAGRNNANSDNPHYDRGWLLGWHQRMWVWNSFSQPAGIDDAETAS